MATPLSREQRSWLKDLGDLVGEAPTETLEDKPEQGAKEGAQDTKKKSLVGAPTGDEKEALVGFSPLDIPTGLAEKLLGPLSVTCMINNNTEQALKLDSGDVTSGEYKDFPPSLIKAEDQSSKFVAVNKTQDLLIVKIHTAGVEGIVRYLVDEQKTAWVLHFNNPRVGDNTADARVEGPNAAQFETPKVLMGGGGDAKFLYVLNRKGGTGPNPKDPKDPKKDPAPAAPVPSSCMINVVNDTGLTLKRAEAKHERGDFMVPPPTSIPPGGNVNFASVETPNAKEQGCKGFVVWEVGSPVSAVWRIEWDNPEQAKNTSSATLTPQSAGFGSQDSIGQGEENVPVQFTISGGGGGGGKEKPPGPKPKDPVDPEPPVEPEVPFEPPAKAKQPTLRKGDKTPDGWVEYAQLLLNFHLKTNLKLDGNFGSGTQAAVIKFQQTKKLQVDGTIGNQTWAALREGAPEKPSTDGREPHTFVEKGVEARWRTEKGRTNIYLTALDQLQLSVESVGDAKLDPATQATVRVSPPGGTVKTLKVALGPAIENPEGDGAVHHVTLKEFRKKFPSVPPGAKGSTYLIDAYLPDELGGDRFSGNVDDA
jgi:peptidoglycan hydrolase-like protein with peptidoglycan-binding domain